MDVNEYFVIGLKLFTLRVVLYFTRKEYLNWTPEHSQIVSHDKYKETLYKHYLNARIQGDIPLSQSYREIEDYIQSL